MEPFYFLNQNGASLKVAEHNSNAFFFPAVFNLVELLSKTVPLPHIPSSWQIAPKVDKWIFLTQIWSFQTCEVPGPNSDGRIWNEQQMAGIDEERKMTKLSRAGEAVIINHAFDFRGEISSKTRANICSLHTLLQKQCINRHVCARVL